MTAVKERIPLGRAVLLMEEAKDILAPVCERIEEAGSIRREQDTIGDIELVCIPKVEQVPTGLFGDTSPFNLLDNLVTELLATRDDRLALRYDKDGRPAVGERYKRLLFRGFPLDLFSVLPPAQWGVIYTIRTGPADFSHRLVTPVRMGGWLPDGMKVHNGQLLLLEADGALRPVETPEERDLFAAIGREYIYPPRRGLEA